MNNKIEACTVATGAEFAKGQVLFTNDGNTIDRILSVQKFNADDRFWYDVECSKAIYTKIENGELTIYGLDDYVISPCSTYWTSGGR